MNYKILLHFFGIMHVILLNGVLKQGNCLRIKCENYIIDFPYGKDEVPEIGQWTAMEQWVKLETCLALENRQCQYKQDSRQDIRNQTYGHVHIKCDNMKYLECFSAVEDLEEAQQLVLLLTEKDDNDVCNRFTGWDAYTNRDCRDASYEQRSYTGFCEYYAHWKTEFHRQCQSTIMLFLLTIGTACCMALLMLFATVILLLAIGIIL